MKNLKPLLVVIVSFLFIIAMMSISHKQEDMAFDEIKTCAQLSADVTDIYTYDRSIHDVLNATGKKIKYEVMYLIEKPLKAGGRGAFICTKEAYDNCEGIEFKYKNNGNGVLTYSKSVPNNIGTLYHKVIIFNP